MRLAMQMNAACLEMYELIISYTRIAEHHDSLVEPNQHARQ